MPALLGSLFSLVTGGVGKWLLWGGLALALVAGVGLVGHAIENHQALVKQSGKLEEELAQAKQDVIDTEAARRAEHDGQARALAALAADRDRAVASAAKFAKLKGEIANVPNADIPVGPATALFFDGLRAPSGPAGSPDANGVRATGAPAGAARVPAATGAAGAAGH